MQSCSSACSKRPNTRAGVVRLSATPLVKLVSFEAVRNRFYTAPRKEHPSIWQKSSDVALALVVSRTGLRPCTRRRCIVFINLVDIEVPGHGDLAGIVGPHFAEELRDVDGAGKDARAGANECVVDDQ